jgi:DNA-binding NarL/FixJ family response regulator
VLVEFDYTRQASKIRKNCYFSSIKFCSMPKKTKVIIADNHNLVRSGYVSLFRNIDDFEVVGEAENGRELLDLLPNIETDIVLLDLEMPVLSGNDALKVLKRDYPGIRVIIISFHSEQRVIEDCIRQGARAYLSKNCNYETFLAVLKSVKEKGFYHSEAVQKAIVKTPEEKANNLTDREIEILVLICTGKANKEIAFILNVVVKTIDFHKGNIYRKTGTYNTAGLYKYAIQHGYIGAEVEN